MGLLQPAVSSSAFLKGGVLGFQGGGKTLTSALILIGLYHYTQKLGLNDGTKPVAMFDTEKGSDWLIPIFKAARVPFVVAKKNTFSDLLKVMDEAEKAAFALIIDSITHPWRELVESYLRKKERNYLAMDDWGYLKGEHGWKQFTDRYIGSQLHIVMAGRAGFEYENYVEDGRKKMEKVGTKMKTEGETGYEPDLLILMEQVEDTHTNVVSHQATVQKDRSTYLDGQQFTYPAFTLPRDGEPFENKVFSDFLPHIKCLALGGKHISVDSTGDSQHHIKLDRKDWSPVQRRICIDEIQTLLSLHHPGSTAVEKTAKLKLVLKHFNTVWTEIEEVMPLPDLRAGYDSLHVELEGKPSKYGNIVADTGAPVPLNDSLPDHAAPPAMEPPVTEPASVEQQLIADIKLNTTVNDCTQWALGISARLANGELKLPPDAFVRITNALMEHQKTLTPKVDEQPKAGKGKTKPAPRADLEEDEATGIPKGLLRTADNKVPGTVEAADVGGMYGLINA